MTGASIGQEFDLHGERAARRGNPSFVWRAGQERRLEMCVRWGIGDRKKRVRRILVDGCGVGMYVNALRPYADEICGIDIEPEHLAIAAVNAAGAELQRAACEALPYADGVFDLVLSHEVIEHVQSDELTAAEMVRVLRPGGRAVIFAPNRLYPFETHGYYWRGVYHFGNKALINYLPDVMRNQLVPHVRAYTALGLRSLYIGQPVRVIHHVQIYPGYDNIAGRHPFLGKWLQRVTYLLEQSPLMVTGLSHLLVIEKI